MARKKHPAQVKVLPLTEFASGASPPLPLLTDAETHGLISRPWHLMDVRDDGRRLVISLTNPTQLRGVQIAETEQEVSVAVYETPPHPGPSVATHTTAFASVILKTPLGNRKLTGGRQ